MIAVYAGQVYVRLQSQLTQPHRPLTATAAHAVPSYPAPVLPAKATGSAAPTSKATAAQQLKQTQQRGREPPSFAASGAAAPASAAGPTSGVFGSLLKSAAAALRPSASQQQSSPSFAASPLWGRSAGPAEQPPPAAASKAHAAAAAAATAAATAAPKVSASVTSNPLWRWAQLGAPAEAPATPPAGEDPMHHMALKRFARLDGSTHPKAAKPAGSLSKAAALLKYAKMAKK